MSELFKTLSVWTSKTEAQLALGYLESKGFHPRLNGAKEYASHVTGVDSGRYEIAVPESEFDCAHAALKAVHTSSAHDDSESSDFDEKYRRKAIYTFILSILIIPIIGNILSFRYIWKMNSGLYSVSRGILFALNALFTGFFLYYLFNTYLN